MKSQILSDRFNGLIRFFLYALVFWLPYSPAVIEICVIASLILWLIKRSFLADWSDLKVLSLRKKMIAALKFYKPKDTFLNRPIFFFLGACFLSVLSSAFPGIALRGLLTKTSEWFVIYFLVIEVFDRKKYIMMALKIFLFTSFAVCIDGLIQSYITGRDIFFGHTIVRGGVTASFNHPNGLAGYLLFVVGISLGVLLAYRQNRKVKFTFLGFITLAVWILLLTLSRAGWLGLIISALLLSFSLDTKKIFRILIVVFSLGLIYWLLPFEIKNQFRINPSAIYYSILYRKDLWMDGIRMFWDKPIFGHGLNMFMRVFQAYRRPCPGLQICPPTYAHNCYVQIATEVGIMGFVCFLWIIFRFLFNIFRKTRDLFLQDEKQKRSILLGLAIGCAGFLIQIFFETSLYSLQLSTLFWFMAGQAVSLAHLLNYPGDNGKLL